MPVTGTLLERFHPNPPKLPLWFWLIADVLLMPALFGGVAAAFLLRDDRIVAGLFVTVAWLTYLALGVSFLTRRNYASAGFALTWAVLGLIFAVGTFVMW